MRLTEQEIQAIRSAVERNFGPRAQVFVFGSRADDTRRGGDIDLFVETELAGAESLRARIATITDIQLALGDQKIDIVTPDAQALVVSNARRDGVAL